jgi:DNA segregation ATPase FtsK/SpoIIIE-like protein
MATPSSFFAVKAARVAAPQQQQQQQQQPVLKQVQPQPTADAAKVIKAEPAARGCTPVPAPAAAEAARGATPVNASRRTLVLKSYPELKKECEETAAVRQATARD